MIISKRISIGKKEIIDFFNNRLNIPLYYFDWSRMDIYEPTNPIAIRKLCVKDEIHNELGNYYLTIPFKENGNETFTKIVNTKATIGNYIIDKDTIQLLTARFDCFFVTTDYYKLKQIIQLKKNIMKEFIYGNAYKSSIGNNSYLDAIKDMKRQIRNIRHQLDEVRTHSI